MANHYVREGAAGAADGSNWTDAWTTLPATLVRGDTYYVADGSYVGYTFNDNVSGTDLITIKKASATEHGTDTGWDSSYGDGQAVFSGTLNFYDGYHVIDGSYRSTWTSGYGFKLVTGQAKGINVTIANTTHITIKYMEIEGTYSEEGTANDLLYQNADGCSDITFQYCYLQNAGRCPFLIRALDNFLVEYCYIYKNLSSATQHAEMISASHRSNVGNDNCIIRYNIVEDSEGTGVIVFRGDGWEIYGNLFIHCNGSNGSITTWSTEVGEPSVTNAKVYNNTIVDGVGYNQGTTFAQTGASPSGNVHYNNLYFGCDNVSISGCAETDYNAYESTESEAHEQIVTSAIFLDYAGDDFHLSGATDAGTTLASPYNVDMDGVGRGADGTWDRGAYEYGSFTPSTARMHFILI